jgi:hypothetical protein
MHFPDEATEPPLKYLTPAGQKKLFFTRFIRSSQQTAKSAHSKPSTSPMNLIIVSFE